jgi:hypothetical protein
LENKRETLEYVFDVLHSKLKMLRVGITSYEETLIFDNQEFHYKREVIVSHKDRSQWVFHYYVHRDWKITMNYILDDADSKENFMVQGNTDALTELAVMWRLKGHQT